MRLGAMWRERWRFVRAQVSSALATAVDWGVVTVVVTAGRDYRVAAVAGALAGAGVDFSIKRWWVFRAGGSPIHGQAFRYALVSGASAALVAGFATLLVGGLHFHQIAGVIVASAIVGFVWNYPLQRWFVFATRPAATGGP